MTETEFAKWSKFQMRNAGNWTVDPIHNTEEDFLTYCSMPNDPSSGIFVWIETGKVTAGRYTDAIPHMGEASYKVKTTVNADNPWKVALERLGLQFLLAVMADPCIH